MFSYDLRFLTSDESLHIKSLDLKTNKYENKKKHEETIFDVGKRTYYEKRGEKTRATRPRQLRELETLLRDKNIVFCEWTNSFLITIVFSSGVLAYLTVKPDNLDITQLLFDRYCIGKLSGQSITNVVFSRNHLLFLHNERTATLITLTKPASESIPTRISTRTPHLQHIELMGGTRKAERRVSWCESGTSLKVLIWSTTSSEPAPWSPVSEDRANLHLYFINGTQINLIGYHQLENETLCAELSQSDSTIHIVEQIPYQMNGVCLKWIRFEIPPEDGVRKLMSSRESITQVPLTAPARAIKRSPCDNRLLIGCIDGTLHIIHKEAALTHSTRAGFIVTEVCWAGELVVAVEERGRLQCFDKALSLLQHHSKCIDLAQHLRESRRMSVLAARNTRGGSAMLTSFAGGPLATLRILHPKLPKGWLRCGRTGPALALLRAQQWDCEGAAALQTVWLAGLKDEAVAQAALGAYLAPAAPLPPAALERAAAINDRARIFFHHLLRRGRWEKALRLAEDVSAWDLFADARWALRAARPRAAAHALRRALRLASDRDSSCSASCSQCSSHSDSSYSESDEEQIDDIKTKAPPLPRIPSLLPKPTFVPVPISTNENISTNSIRPNLHQYLDRDLTIWNTDVKKNGFNIASSQNNLQPIWPTDSTWTAKKTINKNNIDINESHTRWWPKPSHSVIDVIPRPQEDRLSSKKISSLYQTELKEEIPPSLVHTNMYRYHNDHNMVSDRSAIKSDRTLMESQKVRQNGEKNKVKFSDTVTIAVVSEEGLLPEPNRELADSLPLCAPHAYLADFAPAPAPPPAGTTLDYVEV